MDKMRMESQDLTQANIDKITELFPSAITETKDENGKLKRAVNFELLKQLLSPDVVDGDEAYEFTWVGKKASIVEAGKPIRKTLRPCKAESKSWENTENLYIEGDNLDVLKLLQESYLGKVKMIYIDPPYNTGNDFIYRDNFTMDKDDYDEEAGVYDEDGDKLFRNTESNGRFHSDWCSMMYPRLVLARNLLSDVGTIFISIDSGESAQLRKICDEIFGEDNFVDEISWFKKASPSNDAQYFSNDVEYILVYAKQKATWRPNRLPLTEKQMKYYQNSDNDPRGPWNSATYTCNKNKDERPNLFYPIRNPFTNEDVWPKETSVWAYSKEQCSEHIKNNLLFWGIDGTARFPRFKKLLDNHQGVVNRTFWHYDDVNHTQGASEELKKFNIVGFATPKPTRLIKKMLQIATDNNSIILDFFSGSATTAHAVMQLNAEDGGNRKFIMVQLPEECPLDSEALKAGYANICEIGKERIRRAGDKILQELASGKGAKDGSGYGMGSGSGAGNADGSGGEMGNPILDTGFRVLKLDSTNMKDVYYSAGEYDQGKLTDLISNIKDDRDDMDLLYGCLLEWGLPLSLPHTSEQIGGVTVHTYNNGDLIACFAPKVSEAVVREIAGRKPLRVVFRDSSFADAPAKINVEEIFKLMAPNTTVKVL